MSQGKWFLELAALAGERTFDSSYHAAFYLLSTDQDLMAAARKYVNVNGINFSGMKRNIRGLDETRRQIVDIAHNLFSWNSRCGVMPFDISRLEYPYMEQVCHAMYIASYQYEVVIETDLDNNPVLKLDASRYQRNQRMHRNLKQLYCESLNAADKDADMER